MTRFGFTAVPEVVVSPAAESLGPLPSRKERAT
jgi:hypothetical protein